MVLQGDGRRGSGVDQPAALALNEHKTSRRTGDRGDDLKGLGIEGISGGERGVEKVRTG